MKNSNYILSGKVFSTYANYNVLQRIFKLFCSEQHYKAHTFSAGINGDTFIKKEMEFYPWKSKRLCV